MIGVIGLGCAYEGRLLEEDGGGGCVGGDVRGRSRVGGEPAEADVRRSAGEVRSLALEFRDRFQYGSGVGLRLPQLVDPDGERCRAGRACAPAGRDPPASVLRLQRQPGARCAVSLSGRRQPDGSAPATSPRVAARSRDDCISSGRARRCRCRVADRRRPSDAVGFVDLGTAVTGPSGENNTSPVVTPGEHTESPSAQRDRCQPLPASYLSARGETQTDVSRLLPG